MRYYLRALGIITLKIVAMTFISIVDYLYLAQYVPVKVHALIMGIVLFLITFLFAEWIWWKNPRVSWGRVGMVVGVTYAWDVLFTGLLWSALLADATILFAQTWLSHLIGILFYTAAFMAALYDRRRLS